MGKNKSKQAKEEPKTEESCFFSLENHEQQQQINLIDATPSNLQLAFGLQSFPKVLKNENGVCIFHVKGSTWSSKLENDSLYKVPQPAKGKLSVD